MDQDGEGGLNTAWSWAQTGMIGRNQEQCSGEGHPIDDDSERRSAGPTQTLTGVISRLIQIYLWVTADVFSQAEVRLVLMIEINCTRPDEDINLQQEVFNSQSFQHILGKKNV